MEAPDSLVFNANAWAGGTDLTGWTLEFGVGAFADSTFTSTTAVTDLPVLCEAGGCIQGAIAGTACVVGITYALPAFTAPMSW